MNKGKWMSRTFCSLAIAGMVFVGHMSFVEASDFKSDAKIGIVSEVGEKSEVGHEYYVSIDDIEFDEDGKMIVRVRIKSGLEAEQYRFAVDDKEIIDFLKTMEDKDILDDYLYKFHLENELKKIGKMKENNKLIGIESLDREDYEILATPMYKIGDKWIFAQWKSDDIEIAYVELEMNEACKKELEEQDIDNVFEKLRYCSVEIQLDETGDINYLSSDGKKESIYSLENRYFLSRKEELRDSDALDVEKKRFVVNDINGQIASITTKKLETEMDEYKKAHSKEQKLEEETNEEMAININASHDEIEKGLDYVGTLMKKGDEVFLLGAREYSEREQLTYSDLETIANISDLDHRVIIKSINDETDEVDVFIIGGNYARSWTGKVDTENDIYTIDYDEIETKNVADSVKYMSKRTVDLESGQVIYSDIDPSELGEGLSLDGGLMIDNLKQYTISNFQNSFKINKESQEGDQYFLKIDGIGEVDLDRDIDVFIKNGEGLISSSLEEFVEEYDLYKAFNCKLISDYRDTSKVTALIIENAKRR